MPITRRQLLASLAAVAGAIAARGAPRAAVAGAAPRLTAREAHYVAEHRWAVDSLLEALASGDFSRWDGGEESERPERWRLARCVVELQDPDGLTPLEMTLREEFNAVWVRLTLWKRVGGGRAANT